MEVAYVIGAIVGTLIGLRLIWELVLGAFVRVMDSIISLPGKETVSFAKMLEVSYQTPILLITGSGENDPIIDNFQKNLLPSIEPLVKEKGYPLYFANIRGLVALSPLVRFLKENEAKFRGVFVIKDGDLLSSRKTETTVFFREEDKIHAIDAIREALGGSWGTPSP